MTPNLDMAPLKTAAEAAIADGLTACQVAVARDGQILWTESFGSAEPNTRFWIASATKPIVASAIWLLIDEGKLGKIFHYRAVFLQDWTISPELAQGGDRQQVSAGAEREPALTAA